jgi:hypothetical protein
MAGITNREREDKARIAEIKLRLKEPMPIYAYAKLNSSLSALEQRQDRRIAERKAKLEAARDEAERYSRPYVSHLPDNGRMVRD